MTYFPNSQKRYREKLKEQGFVHKSFWFDPQCAKYISKIMNIRKQLNDTNKKYFASSLNTELQYVYMNLRSKYLKGEDIDHRKQEE